MRRTRRSQTRSSATRTRSKIRRGRPARTTPTAGRMSGVAARPTASHISTGGRSTSNWEEQHHGRAAAAADRRPVEDLQGHARPAPFAAAPAATSEGAAAATCAATASAAAWSPTAATSTTACVWTGGQSLDGAAVFRAALRDRDAARADPIPTRPGAHKHEASAKAGDMLRETCMARIAKLERENVSLSREAQGSEHAAAPQAAKRLRAVEAAQAAPNQMQRQIGDGSASRLRGVAPMPGSEAAPIGWRSACARKKAKATKAAAIHAAAAAAHRRHSSRRHRSRRQAGQRPQRAELHPPPPPPPQRRGSSPPFVARSMRALRAASAL